ncbi:MAG TPA: T9SS type A sorting domain-containing protein, partial [Flavisolibacter sp.]
RNNAATDTVRLADTSAALAGGSFSGCAITSHTAYYYVDDVVVSQVNGSISGCSVLPLHWLSFAGKRRNDVVELQWKTVNEINTSHFIIERSRNGFDFVAIGKEQAKNTNGEHAYDFTDAQPLAGINYYRLKQVDRNGTSVYSSVAKVFFGDAVSNGLRLYPQPADAILHVAFGGNGGNVMIQVYDATGRLVLNETKRNSNTMTLNTQKLSRGTYWVVASDGVIQQKGQFLKQ